MPNEQQNQQQLIIHTQYIKDLSFENPNSPAVYLPSEAQPEIQININVTANPQEQERFFEVVLTITANATRDGKGMFVAELSYAGIVSVAENVDSKVIHPLVMIEGPRLLFPFARQILSEITQSGGFLPLNIQPIDFVRVYQAGIESQQNSEAAPAPDTEVEKKPNKKSSKKEKLN
ncbi:protein-export chaperone SecB [Alphaproteobacteria bacterium LSUCC0684]